MILRKPYALLIKYFKLIHIIMFIFFGYMVFVLQKIYVFFSEYAKTSNYTYVPGMASKYISPIAYIIVVILLAFSIGIFLLMRKKDKPVLFYKVLIAYTSILLIALIYYAVFFKSLDDTVYSPLRIVINRDIILFIYLFNFFFVAVSFIRGFGFDIKKFSFEKDKKVLKLEESDSEEYELNVNLDKDDVKKYFNRQKREIIYYFKENSTFFIIVLVIAFISLSLYFYYDFFIINKIYKENQTVKLSDTEFTVKSSHLTDLNKYGRSFDNDDYYLVVIFDISNNYKEITYDEQGLRVNVDGEYYYPQNATCDMFNDIGECYKSGATKTTKDKEFILVYRIKSDYKKIYFEILKSKSGGFKYSKVLLSPDIYLRDLKLYNVSDHFIINNNTYSVNSYEFVDKISYEYEECKDEVCSKYTKIVKPVNGEKVLVLDIEGLEKLDTDLIDYYFSIRYNKKSRTLSDKITVLSRYKDKLYLSVPTPYDDQEEIVLIITTRTQEYDILLREGSNE